MKKIKRAFVWLETARLRLKRRRLPRAEFSSGMLRITGSAFGLFCLILLTVALLSPNSASITSKDLLDIGRNLPTREPPVGTPTLPLIVVAAKAVFDRVFAPPDDMPGQKSPARLPDDSGRVASPTLVQLPTLIATRPQPTQTPALIATRPQTVVTPTVIANPTPYLLLTPTSEPSSLFVPINMSQSTRFGSLVYTLTSALPIRNGNVIGIQVEVVNKSPANIRLESYDKNMEAIRLIDSGGNVRLARSLTGFLKDGGVLVPWVPQVASVVFIVDADQGSVYGFVHPDFPRVVYFSVAQR